MFGERGEGQAVPNYHREKKSFVHFHFSLLSLLLLVLAATGLSSNHLLRHLYSKQCYLQADLG
jgi:hypothetical protein